MGRAWLHVRPVWSDAVIFHECEADPLTVEVAAALAEVRGRFTDARARAAAWTLPPYPGDE